MVDEFDTLFPRPETRKSTRLASVVSGSLSKGLEAKLAPDQAGASLA
jgi:hypothetical protein